MLAAGRKGYPFQKHKQIHLKNPSLLDINPTLLSERCSHSLVQKYTDEKKKCHIDIIFVIKEQFWEKH